MTKKIDQIIQYVYLLLSLIGLICAVMSIIGLIKNSDSFFIFLSDFILITILFIPVFFYLKRVFCKKFNNETKSISNKLKYIKYSGYIIFFVSVIVMLYSANSLSNNLDFEYKEEMQKSLILNYVIIRDLATILWIIIVFIFSFDYIKNKNISSRVDNLNQFFSLLIIFGLLIPFHKVIGLLLFDLELYLINLFR